MKVRNKTGLALSAVAVLLLSACSSASTDSAASAEETSAASTCSKDSLATIAPGTITIATGEPAYFPWVIDDKPESGEGFESAVAYAVAEKLGYVSHGGLSAVERFMKRYFLIAKDVGDLTAIVCASLEARHQKPVTGFNRFVGKLRRREKKRFRNRESLKSAPVR